MSSPRHVVMGCLLVVATAGCGERLIYEASTDPTLTTIDSTASENSNPSGGTTSSADTIAWARCDVETYLGEYDCGTLEVPFDYERPDVGTFSLSLMRRRADLPEQRIGSILVNPGGPGFGGTAVAEQAQWYLSSALLERFDVVGWDPRGTGTSTPAVDCIDQYDRYFGLDSPPNDERAKRAMIDVTQEFVDLCVEKNGEMLRYISTESSARDMDSIRRALGEEKITYFGFSYGSELGATWVTLFPETVRAAVFDGASDPNASGLDQAMAQLMGFEQQLDAFLANCASRPACQIHNNGNPAALFDDLAQQIDRTPIFVRSDRTPVTQGVFYTAVVQAMYSNTMWPQLEAALAAAVAGRGDQLLRLYDEYYQRQPDGTYGNELEAFLAISCLDDPERTSVADIDTNIPKFAAAAKRLGESFGYGYACALWPYRVNERITVTGKGAGPIVVIGTTGDAATPLESTRRAAGNLEDGRLVIVEADRHTGYGLNDCVVREVDAYLLRLIPPKNETYCK